MKQCPVCSAAMTGSICAQCGYDRSTDYTRYPTFTPFVPVNRNHTKYQTCPNCGSYTFALRRDDRFLVCLTCMQEMPYSVEPSQGSWKEHFPPIAAGESCTVARCPDGTAKILTRLPVLRDIDVSHWNGIDMVAAGKRHIAALGRDGSVFVEGQNHNHQCDVENWTDVTAIAAGDYLTMGLRADGTVLTAGYDEDGQRDTSGWPKLTAIAAGGFHTVGLGFDKCVYAAGFNRFGQCDVGD